MVICSGKLFILYGGDNQMNILIINACPHKGNTWILAELVKKQILELNNTIVFDEVQLNEMNIPFCCGCSLCFRKGHEFCPHNQYIKKIMDKIAACDGFIIAASCYQGAVPAICKNFTDHLAFLIHRPRYFDKKALVISTTGGVSANSVTKSLANTLPGWGVNKCYQLPIVALSWNDYKPTEKHIKKAYKISKRFYNDVKSNKLHSPRIGPLIPFNLYRAMCSDYGPKTEYPTLDGVFWKQYQRMVYAKGIPVPLYKKIFGHFVFGVGKKISSRMIVTYKK